LSILILLGLSTVFLFNMESTGAKPYSFSSYKADYAKIYADLAEEQYRKTIFLRNIIKIEEHNADKTQTYTKGINQFSDLTDEEFKAQYLTLMAPHKKVTVISEESFTPIVGDVDWVAQGKVTAVKNQGSCGSCWAFSAIGAVESAYLFAGQNLNLAEQQLVDCAGGKYGNQGCRGGWMDSAFQFGIDNGLTY